MTLPKQAIAFPEVAIMRKGTPKRKNPKKPGTWMQGLDLNNRFRIAFAPGTDHVKAKFESVFPGSKRVYGADFAEPEGYEMTKVRAMITTRSVYDAWEWANEAYNAGRLIARADDSHFITLRDPLTGEYLVENGEPYREYKHGMTVDYERNGQKYSLPIRTYGRLRLLLPELGQLVAITLKTTSFYDRLNISANLAAIQFLADTLNGGNSAGIPFYIYRMEKEITWNKPGGDAQRIKKWIVQIEADEDWVKTTMQRMSAFALGGETMNTLALPGASTGIISGQVDPSDVEDEQDAGDFIDAESTTIDPVQDETDEEEAYRKACFMKSSDGVEYGARTDAQLQWVVNNTKSPADKREAAETILKWRAAHK